MVTLATGGYTLKENQSEGASWPENVQIFPSAGLTWWLCLKYIYFYKGGNLFFPVNLSFSVGSHAGFLFAGEVGR